MDRKINLTDIDFDKKTIVNVNFAGSYAEIMFDDKTEVNIEWNEVIGFTYEYLDRDNNWYDIETTK